MRSVGFGGVRPPPGGDRPDDDDDDVERELREIRHEIHDLGHDVKEVLRLLRQGGGTPGQEVVTLQDRVRMEAIATRTAANLVRLKVLDAQTSNVPVVSVKTTKKK